MIFERYESESAGKIEELEHAKMKLQARLAEAEDTIEGTDLFGHTVDFKSSVQGMKDFYLERPQ